MVDNYLVKFGVEFIYDMGDDSAVINYLRDIDGTVSKIRKLR